MQNIQSRLLGKSRDLVHAFTTRHAKTNAVGHKNNNMAFHTGDEKSSVLRNHKALAKNLDYDLARLVHMRQIHSDKVVVVDKQHDFTHPPECDAVITNLPQRPLMVMTADCTPILLYDKQKKVIAAVHAGRAGAFSDIAGKTVDTMKTAFGCDPNDIIAAFGPSIGRCCYEVGEVVEDEALELSFDYAIHRREGSTFLDINTIIKKQLHKAGMKLHNIEEIKRCSSCENDLFFSYRADKQKTGRMAGIIMLNSSL